MDKMRTLESNMDKPPETNGENPPAYTELSPPAFILYTERPPPPYDISETPQQSANLPVTAPFLPPTGQPLPAFNTVYFIPPPLPQESNQQRQQQQQVVLDFVVNGHHYKTSLFV